ncbi:MAG: replication-associated recombination protein A [Candidatus Schekmanbacteria bacterium]|nr:replication-associated recombination protein A [Candidatus Schekmanbacteria bacterium]
MELFEYDKPKIVKPGKFAPLAERMRPNNLDEFVGQDHILGEGKFLRKAIEEDSVSSIILWGPPGSGKTTLAQIISQKTGATFISFSAVTSGIKEIKEVIKTAKENLERYGKRTIIFIDEIHRFNKAQQDAFLPYVEEGAIILIGATTENPSFEVISPLLSRTRVYTLHALTEEEIIKIIKRALNDKEHGVAKYNPDISDDTLSFVASLSGGDGRVALNVLDVAITSEKPDADGKRKITNDTITQVMQKKALIYDKAGEEHYNIISAFHKSLRGSDPDASLYWLARMLEAGEDPLYIARRMVRFASEDVGNADPQALLVANAAKEAVDFLGMPEGDLALAQTAIYLATAPKSNATYMAYLSAKKEVRNTGYLPVPLHLRNPVTDLMKEEGYGDGYLYPHSYENAVVKQEYYPKGMKNKEFYTPTDRGFEKKIAQRLEFWKDLLSGKKRDKED